MKKIGQTEIGEAYICCNELKNFNEIDGPIRYGSTFVHLMRARFSRCRFYQTMVIMVQMSAEIRITLK